MDSPMSEDDAAAMQDRIQKIGFNRIPIDPGFGVVSRIEVRVCAGRESIRIFNRGVDSGTIAVMRGDGETIARALMPHAKIEVL